MDLDRTGCYYALRSRDRRFDGRFFVGVKTTGVYCRPVCPAPTPKLENVDFFACAAAAEKAGFRPCRRCRPETSPGTPAWEGSSAVVSRALRLIRGGMFDEGGIAAVVERLGVGARELRRLFARHLGTSPAAVARARRVHFARALLDETEQPVTAIAFAAGFQSVRQFNHAVRATFGSAPRVLRRRRRSSRMLADGGRLAVRLAYRPPLDWPALIAFLAARATPGVERVDGSCYRRTIEMRGAAGALEVEPAGEACLVLRLRLPDVTGAMAAVERVRRMLDLGADPLRIAGDLRRSAVLRPLVDAAPGLRVPGAWDAFEIAVRAVLGQQVSVRAARTLAGRLVEAFGTPADCGPGLTHLFPTPERLAGADVAGIGLPRARADTIRALSAAVARGDLALDGARGLDDAVTRLRALPGVGEWTAQYIAMRALGEPDAFLAGDLGVRKALANGTGIISAVDAERLAQDWRPWRAYAVMHLWGSLAGRGEEVSKQRSHGGKR